MSLMQLIAHQIAQYSEYYHFSRCRNAEIMIKETMPHSILWYTKEDMYKHINHMIPIGQQNNDDDDIR